jgi:surfactin synthase thioesterase subunit
MRDAVGFEVGGRSLAPLAASAPTTAPTAQPESPWVRMSGGNGQAKLRVFCFAHAGSGASFYSRWHKLLPPDVEICRIALPGRETRRQENAYTQMRDLIPPLFAALRPFMDQPFALFGHSMGAAVAYEVARQCEAHGINHLRHLFVSGRRAPHLPARRRPFYNLPIDEFLAMLQSLSGTPDSVMAEQGLLDLFLPCLRADFELIETYVPLPGIKLQTGISAYCGDTDPEVECSELSAWRHATDGHFKSRIFNGHHFYLQPMTPELTEELTQALHALSRCRENS